MNCNFTILSVTVVSSTKKKKHSAPSLVSAKGLYLKAWKRKPGFKLSFFFFFTFQEGGEKKRLSTGLD